MVKRKKNKSPIIQDIFKEKWLIIIWIIISIISSLIPTALIYLNKISIDNISKLNSNRSVLELCIFVITVMFLLKLLSSLLTFVIDYIYSKIKKNINYSLQKKLYEKLINISFNNYENNEFYNKIKLAGEAINRNGIDVLKYIVEILKNIISIMTLISLLFTINKILPVALLGSTIPGIVILFISKSLRYKIYKNYSEDMRKYSFLSSLFMNKPYLKEMIIFRFDRYALEKWSKLFKSVMKKDLKSDLFEGIGRFIGIFILESISTIFSIFLIYQIANKGISIGDFVSLTTAIVTVQSSIAMIGSNLGGIFEINLYNKAFLEILNYEVGNNEQNGIEIKEIEKIEFRNVSFNYDNCEKYVLNNINLIINKGDKIALVGENGSGKSTIVNLILGLYDNYDGKILINDIDIEEINKTSYIKNISVILQDFNKYSLSLRENIGVSNVNEINDDNKVVENIKNIGLYNKLRTFNTGLETYLTKQYKDGEELSGGEWQKIAIGRGIFKNSNIVILDEPTSALDPLSELEVFKLFEDLSNNKTTITISHRLGITRYSNKIIVMEKGKIIEIGTHKELINLGEKYFKLYTSQSNWYKESLLYE